MTPLHPALLPPQPSEPEPRRREGLLLAGFALLGAVVVLGGLFGYQRFTTDGGDSLATAQTKEADQSDGPPQSEEALPEESEQLADESAAEPQEQPAQEDPPDSAPNGTQVVACPAEYDNVICDAAEFVQLSRGRPFKEFPTIELLGDAEFDAALIEDFGEFAPELEEDERVLKALGLIPVETDLVETFRSLLEAGVVGFYDPETGRLVVRGGDFDLYGQSILVHELVHAFDDQWFDLDRDDFATDDAKYGFRAVVEGNASRVEDLWKESLSPEEILQLTEQEFGSLSFEDLQLLRSLPPVLLELQASPYIDGQRYVRTLDAAGGEAAVDERLVDPPSSSEQVLRPGAAAEQLVIVDLDEPAPGGSPRLSGGTLGELWIGLWLDEEAASGWGGDSYVVWQNGGGACLAVDIAPDTPNDGLQLEVAANRWAAEQVGERTVQTVATADRTLVRVTGCY